MTRKPARPSWATLGAIAVGGIVGATARYGVAQLVHVRPGRFPWATFIVNVTGSFALGALLTVLGRRSTVLRPLLATGFLGAFTTYSTFAVETDVLLRDGHAATALTYAVTSLACGLLAVTLGVAVARR